MKIALVDQKQTALMQVCGVFEKFKVIAAGVFDIDTMQTPEQVFNLLIDAGEKPIFVSDGDVVLTNNSIKVVSDGRTWNKIEWFVKKSIHG